MTRSIVEPSARPGPDTAPVVQAVTAIMGTVVGLTFLFGFGNVLNLALRLGVPVWVAPLVAPAVDLSILGLLLGTRHLALHGADPLVTGAYGEAAFDVVGPLLLIGWAEVAPGLLQAITTISSPVTTAFDAETSNSSDHHRAPDDHVGEPTAREGDTHAAPSTVPTAGKIDGSSDTVSEISTHDDLLDLARRAGAQHWVDHRRPISADTLRRKLRISTARARLLVSIIRAEQSAG
jgi:hypothetical protein